MTEPMQVWAPMLSAPTKVFAPSVRKNGTPGRASPRPRVLFLDHSSQISGAEMMLLSLVDRFTGTSTVRLFEDGPLRRRLEDLGIQTIVPPRTPNFGHLKRGRSLLAALPMLDKMARTVLDLAYLARRHDLVYANSLKAFVLGAAAALLARRPLIWHLHDVLDPAYFRPSQLRLLARLANSIAVRIVVPSRAAANAFISCGGHSDRLRIVQNGIAATGADLRADDPAQIRLSLGLPNGFLCGVFSRLSPSKGQHVAIQALTLLPDACCIVVGAALFGEQGYTEHLKALVERLGLAGRVFFLGHRDDVPRLMQAVDVVVHPPLAPESFGRTLVEAMLARRPVIATRVGAVPEIVADGRTGLLVEPGEVAPLAGALALLRSRPRLRDALVHEAEQRARQEFGVDRMRDSLDEILSECGVLRDGYRRGRQ